MPPKSTKAATPVPKKKASQASRSTPDPLGLDVVVARPDSGVSPTLSPSKTWYLTSAPVNQIIQRKLDNLPGIPNTFTAFDNETPNLVDVGRMKDATNLGINEVAKIIKGPFRLSFIGPELLPIFYYHDRLQCSATPTNQTGIPTVLKKVIPLKEPGWIHVAAACINHPPPNTTDANNARIYSALPSPSRPSARVDPDFAPKTCDVENSFIYDPRFSTDSSPSSRPTAGPYWVFQRLGTPQQSITFVDEKDIASSRQMDDVKADKIAIPRSFAALIDQAQKRISDATDTASTPSLPAVGPASTPNADSTASASNADGTAITSNADEVASTSNTDGNLDQGANKTDPWDQQGRSLMEWWSTTRTLADEAQKIQLRDLQKSHETLQAKLKEETSAKEQLRKECEDLKAEIRDERMAHDKLLQSVTHARKAQEDAQAHSSARNAKRRKID